MMQDCGDGWQKRVDTLSKTKKIGFFSFEKAPWLRSIVKKYY
jgi:hypothetical protein